MMMIKEFTKTVTWLVILTVAAVAVADGVKSQNKVDKVVVELWTAPACENCPKAVEYFSQHVMAAQGLPDIMDFSVWNMVMDPKKFVCFLDVVKEGKATPGCFGTATYLCAQSLYPSQPADKFFPYVNCLESQQETFVKTPQVVVKSCAAKASLDVTKLMNCAVGSQGEQLLNAAYTHWQQGKPKVDETPTLMVNGEDQTYNGLQAICYAYKGRKPSGCHHLTNATTLNTTIG